ncbi:hypothetical protein [Streptosporangium sp. NPDC001681]|uniref:WD40 repeat domain-containing protein n=1 Tax=Streptosporangium sp. NPDC001681 TaxID=3154395 RepID=UPI0033308376
MRSGRLLAESRHEDAPPGIDVQLPLVSPDGRWVLSSPGMGRVEIPTGRRTPRQPGPSFIAADVSSKGVAANSRQDKIYLWDIDTGRFLGGIAAEGFGGLVTFSPDGNLIAGTNGAGRIQLWDVATRSPVGVPLQGVHLPPPPPFPAPRSDGYVAGMAFSADGSMFHVIDNQGNLRTHLIGVARIKQALCQEIGPLNPGDWKRYVPDVPYRRSC